MTAAKKRSTRKNITTLLPIGSIAPLYDRETQSLCGELEITSSSQKKVEGIARGQAFGHHGRTLTFRVPNLTQLGGSLQIKLD